MGLQGGELDNELWSFPLFPYFVASPLMVRDASHDEIVGRHPGLRVALFKVDEEIAADISVADLRGVSRRSDRP